MQAKKIISWYLKVYAHKYKNQLKDSMRFLLSGKGLPPSHFSKQKIVKKYSKKYGLDILIETGTYLGNMIKSTMHFFQNIYSIELDEMFFERAKSKFSNYDHIHILQGDSGEKLKDILKMISEPALFWLDAHYFGGITGKGIENTPIIRELEHILSQSSFKHIILIDDARHFNGCNDYPTLEQLEKYIKQKNRNYNMKIENDIIVLTYD